MPRARQRAEPPDEISKETEDVKDTINHPDLTHVWSIPPPATAEHTFFSSACGIFSRIDHRLGLESGLSKF